jgi:hypothetical protein
MGNYPDHIRYARRWLYIWVPAFAALIFFAGGGLVEWLLLPVAVLIYMGGAMLPDIDSPQSKPNQLARQVLGTIVIGSCVTATIFIWPNPALILSAAVVGIAFNWIVTSWFLKHLHHRGAWHSLTAATIYAVSIAAVYAVSGVSWIGIVTVGILAWLGYTNHLVCDEIFSAYPEKAHQLLSWRFIFTQREKKKSAGTALKLWKRKTEKIA